MPSLWTSSPGAGINKSDEILTVIDQKTASIPRYTLALSAFALGVTSTLASTIVYRRFFKRIPNGDWITPDILSKKRWLKGRVVSVGDADNFRIYHTPGLGWVWPLKFRLVPSASKDLKDRTIHIRMAGVDAPEGAHFGRPSQPYFEESLAWLKSQIGGRTVYCQAIRRDQYFRIVAVPYLKPRFLPGFLVRGKCLSLEMIRAGWGVTYEQAGAEYGPYGKDEFLRLQAEAQSMKRGMWRKGLSGETPAEYKRRYAGSIEAAESAAPSTRSKSTAVAKGSLLKTLFGR